MRKNLPFVTKFFEEPDAVAHSHENSSRLFFKDDMCLIAITNPRTERRAAAEYTRNLFKNAPNQIDAAMIVRERILLLRNELVWSYDITKLPANLMEGYPKLFKDLFQGNLLCKMERRKPIYGERDL